MTDTPCAVSVCDKPVSGDRFVCSPCMALLEQALTETDWMVDELNVTITRQQAVRTDGEASGSGERPVPFHIKAAEVRATYHGVLGSWARMLAEENAGWVLPADDLKAIARWLLRRMTTIAGHAAGGDLVEEVLQHRASALWVIDRPAERVYAGPCECGADLYAKPSSPEATCRECNGTYEVEAMQEWMRAQVAERLVTAREASGLLSRFGYETKQKTIDTWNQRKKVMERGHDTKGVRLYLFGDLLTLAAQATTRGKSNAA